MNDEQKDSEPSEIHRPEEKQGSRRDERAARAGAPNMQGNDEAASRRPSHFRSRMDVSDDAVELIPGS